MRKGVRKPLKNLKNHLNKHTLNQKSVVITIIYDFVCKNKIIIDNKKYFTPFIFENAHSGAFSSAKSNGSMRIFNAQRCTTHLLCNFTPFLFFAPLINAHSGEFSTAKSNGSMRMV